MRDVDGEDREELMRRIAWNDNGLSSWGMQDA